MNVDLPTPGTPEMPTRQDVAVDSFALSARTAISSRAAARCSARRDSTKVIARARADREPARTSAARSRVVTAPVTTAVPSSVELSKEQIEQLQRDIDDHCSAPVHDRDPQH